MRTKPALALIGLGWLWVVAGCASDPPPQPHPPPRPPPPRAAAPDPALAPGLNHHQIRQVMTEKADPAVRGCYTVAYSGKEGGTGGLVVDFSVKPDGSVASATINDSTLADPTFEECVRKVYLALVFPKAPGTTDASRPYTFKNASGEAAAAADTGH